MARRKKEVRLIIRFADEKAAVEWFTEVKANGGFAGRAALVVADALDFIGGRANKGDLVVKARADALPDRVRAF